MAKKVGRHAACPCGSGYKFKECCGINTVTLTPDPNSEEMYRDPRFTAINEVIRKPGSKTLFQPRRSLRDKKNTYRFVGDRIYSRPQKETFHEFTIYLLQSLLGKQWHDEQRSLAVEERHQIFKWLSAASQFSKSLSENPASKHGDRFGGDPTGDVAALANLAYDVFDVLRTGPIPRQLLKRLKDKRRFQGARFELLVAAVLVRAWCLPTFLKEKSTKHHDINAHDQLTGATLAIEAKSRHRPGILGFPGIQDESAAMKGDVESLINQALEQNPGNQPFIIFVDLNAPHMPATPLEMRPWYSDIQDLMRSLGEATADNPDEFNSLFFTNFSYHWEGAGKATGGDYFLLHSGHPRTPLSAEVPARILASIKTYGFIPEEI